MNLLDKFFGKKQLINPSTYERDKAGNVWIGFNSIGSGDILVTPQTQITAYNNCPWLSIIMQKKYNYLQNKVTYIVDNKGEDVSKFADAKSVLNLLEKPNKYQTKKQFETQLYYFQQIFGKAYVYRPMAGSTSLPTVMYVIPNWHLSENRISNNFETTEKINIVQSYTFTLNGKSYPNVSPEDIEIFYDTTPNTIEQEKLFDSQSRMATLYEPISNITAALEARGVLIKSRGALGVISPDSKGDVGNAGKLKPEDQTDLQNKFRSLYGLAKRQWQFIFSEKPIRFVKFNISPNELQLFEEIEDSVRTVSQAYGIDIKLLGFESKFQNMNEAEKALYQNTIIPESIGLAEFYNKCLKLKNIQIKYDFSHVQILQESEAEKQAANKANIDKNLLLYQNGFITYNKFLTEIGLEAVPDGDKYSYQMDNQPLAVSIGVGGTQSLTEIAVNPLLSPNQKKNMLMILFGVSEEQATLMTTV